MKLFDYMVKENKTDLDTYDTVYDRCVTISADVDYPPEDDYDEFVFALTKLVDFKEVYSSCEVVCDWIGLIKRNMDVFRDFADKYWYKNNFKHDDDFIPEWIRELHLFAAGYGEDGKYGFYKAELLDKCK